MSEPGCLYAYMFGQLIRNKHNHRLPLKSQHQLLCAHAETVTYVNQALSDHKIACSDSTILAVFALAYHSITIEEKPPKGSTAIFRAPEQGPLKSLRLLNLYGGPIETVSMHREGLLKLIQLRGGIEKITLPGLAGLLC